MKEGVTVDEVIPLVRDYYLPDNPTGGYLHIVLDDGNLDDADVSGCLKDAQDAGDAAGVALARILLEMTEEQREALYDRYDEYAKYRGNLWVL